MGSINNHGLNTYDAITIRIRSMTATKICDVYENTLIKDVGKYNLDYNTITEASLKCKKIKNLQAYEKQQQISAEKSKVNALTKYLQRSVTHFSNIYTERCKILLTTHSNGKKRKVDNVTEKCHNPKKRKLNNHNITIIRVLVINK